MNSHGLLNRNYNFPHNPTQLSSTSPKISSRYAKDPKPLLTHHTTNQLVESKIQHKKGSPSSVFQSEDGSNGENDSMGSSQIEQTPTLTPKNLQSQNPQFQQQEFSLRKGSDKQLVSTQRSNQQFKNTPTFVPKSSSSMKKAQIPFSQNQTPS